MSDLEFEDIQQLLSTPATDPGQVSRRRFLQGAAAASATVGAFSAMPGWMQDVAAAATPVGAGDGILVVIQMGGGNDGLNMLPPRGDANYTAKRGSLAITNPLPLTSKVGLHPALPKLKVRYDAGKVAVVQGVGQTTDDRSHFSSTARWMAGTATTSLSSGWLGRWLDGVPESTGGLRAVSFGASIPLHLVGQQAVVTAMDTGGDLFGSDVSNPAYVAAYDAVQAFADGATGKGQWGDELARAGGLAIDLAGDLDPIFTPPVPNDSLVSQLTLVARLINADLGIRVLNTSFGSFDTHRNQLVAHQSLLSELDGAIDAFYRTLAPSWARRVTILTFSEFGRQLRANASLGTDHANASNLLVIGDNVKGGLYGKAPSLTDLDRYGDPKTHVDFRSVYATVLRGWLDADPVELMGADYEDLRLFRGDPGEPVPLPITTGAWVPFATASDLVRQQYRDFLGREGDASGVAYWADRLERKVNTSSQVILRFLDSAEFGRSMAPVARLALAGLRTPPEFVDLSSWTAASKAGTSLASIAAEVTAKTAFTSHYGAMSNAAYVDAIYRDVAGRPPTASAKATWVGRLSGGSHTRGDLLVALVGTSDAERRFRARVNVLMTYAGLLQRKPDSSGWSYWVPRVQGGTSVERLIAQFFVSSEYRRRFGWP
jgi:uncharacterized protein (DUF1501 family)